MKSNGSSIARDRFVLGFDEIDRTSVRLAGGKGAQLGELSRIEGIRVPVGFCVTTDAFRRILAQAPSLDERFEQLALLSPDDTDAIREVSADIRQTIEGVVIPDVVASAIASEITRFGEQAAYAVRSSATAEDLPTASFAGQQDTYLNIVSTGAILEHVSRCWASLFTERAVAYRLRNGFDHRKVAMAVVVQQMVFADASGVMFTADPVTSNRKVTAVEATLGLGEALVSGLISPDVYRVRDGQLVSKSIATKHLTITATRGGGTHHELIELAQQSNPVLTDVQAMSLAQLGRHIEEHFGSAQDIEWCLDRDGFAIVQSRPITTLFPVPVRDDQDNHVYLSVGHAQMMTDAMKPLGLSFWQLSTPRPMYVAGGRLFVDVAKDLGSPASRAGLLAVFGKSDPLTADALSTILERDNFIPTLPDSSPLAPAVRAEPAPIQTDPAIVTGLIQRSEESIAKLKRDIQTKSGSALLEFILEDIQELKRILFDPTSTQVFMSAMDAAGWLNEHLEAWLGEKNAADVLTQSVPHNITSEMGLALMHVADVIRPYPQVVAALEQRQDDDFIPLLDEVEGGHEARAAIEDFLHMYGMRCAGEIDITRSRWSERPTTLLPSILSNVTNFPPGAGERHFEQGQQEAMEKEVELLQRLRSIPEGEQKAAQTKQMIDRLRTFIGYREYPKYGMVGRYFVYKQALLGEAKRLVAAQVIQEPEDIFYLTFQELGDVVRTQQVDGELIGQRKDSFESYRILTPPRVLTSEGELLNGAYRRDDLPVGALVGLPVSAGTVEGRARVILDMAQADLEPGDILVTAYTDPSWTPTFVTIAGLVTEVGGLMTHGAVIAREYGLPAVVGVTNATQLIRDGQRIRIHGTDGYIQILATS